MLLVGRNKFYYVLGHALCSGKRLRSDVISIKVLDKELCKKICGHDKDISSWYKNTLSINSKELVYLTDHLNKINFDFDCVPAKYYADMVRGIFDALGSINLTLDNHFQILIRHPNTKCIEAVCKILGVKYHIGSQIIRVHKHDRNSIFRQMYIHSDEIRSEKKYKIFKKSLNTQRQINANRDRKGRFASKNAILKAIN